MADIGTNPAKVGRPNGTNNIGTKRCKAPTGDGTKKNWQPKWAGWVNRPNTVLHKTEWVSPKFKIDPSGAKWAGPTEIAKPICFRECSNHKNLKGVFCAFPATEKCLNPICHCVEPVEL